jgi:DNA-binding response OmpR family regulator
MSVLVVEDNPSVASVLQRGLERDGYSVDVAVDGNEALALGLENTYVAIVLDVMIPEPDGLAVARQLRKHGSWVPILMLTPGTGSRTASRGSTQEPTTTWASRSRCAS